MLQVRLLQLHQYSSKKIILIKHQVFLIKYILLKVKERSLIFLLNLQENLIIIIKEVWLLQDAIKLLIGLLELNLLKLMNFNLKKSLLLKISVKITAEILNHFMEERFIFYQMIAQKNDIYSFIFKKWIRIIKKLWENSNFFITFINFQR
jgi:hypothetical protein